jgi:predicted GNAT family acetyltransferase
MATQRGLFISNGSKKGEPNVSGLIKKITEEYKMYIYIQESRACEYAKEIFAKMVELGSIKNWTHWMSDQSLSKELMKEAVKACHLSNEFLEDQELYEGDIQKLIENCPD